MNRYIFSLVLTASLGVGSVAFAQMPPPPPPPPPPVGATTGTTATTQTTTTTTTPVACTTEAKLCPNGSYVSRTGPQCAFAACPTTATSTPTTPPVQTSCLTDFKPCPDGTYVSRSGPQCAFRACPMGLTGTTTVPGGAVPPTVHVTCGTVAGCVATPSTHLTFASTLRVGSSNARVKYIQTLLAKDSAIYPSGKATGYFGSLTRAAVLRFQKAHGIAQVGFVGPATYAKIVAEFDAQ